MDNHNNNMNTIKSKHLSFKERATIKLGLSDGLSIYKIARELQQPINTTLNKIRKGTTIKIKQNKHVKVYLTYTEKGLYRENSKNFCHTFKRFECREFISYEVNKI